MKYEKSRFKRIRELVAKYNDQELEQEIIELEKHVDELVGELLVMNIPVDNEE